MATETAADRCLRTMPCRGPHIFYAASQAPNLQHAFYKGIKMCYAALTKGTSTLQVALLTVAESLGLSAELRAELAYSQKSVLENMESGIPRLPPNAHR